MLPGRIIIARVTDEGYFETRHNSGNNPAMVHGGFDGANMMYLNPDYQELWVEDLNAQVARLLER
ncbi:MAG: hypothetical protein R3E08_11310 [Thiotrichaceae bacterium]